VKQLDGAYYNPSIFIFAIASSGDLWIFLKKEMHYAAFGGRHRREAKGTFLTHSATGGTMGHPLDRLGAALSVALGIDHEPFHKRVLFINRNVQ